MVKRIDAAKSEDEVIKNLISTLNSLNVFLSFKNEGISTG
jgi:hypothetical protein